MTDIHSHILPGVDDGSDSMEASIEMLRIASEEGVSRIVATPHFDRGSGYVNYASEELEARFRSLEAGAERENLRIKLVRGMEIFATDDLPDLLSDGMVWTLGGTDYFMTEFGFEDDPHRCAQILRRCEQRGFRPIIAHPERYRFVQRDPQIAYEWCRSGYGLQLNKGSLACRFGEQTRVLAMRLISHGLAACIASDAHGTRRRTPRMRDVRGAVTEEFGNDFSALLFERNPDRILSGRGLLGLEPYPFK